MRYSWVFLMGGAGDVSLREVRRGLGAPLAWRGGMSCYKEGWKCLDWSKLFANFVETSCIRQYGLGGIGGVDLCRPDISFYCGGKVFF